MFGNPEAKALAGKVIMEEDPLAEQVFFKEKGLAFPSRVQVKTVSGKEFVEEIQYSKGTPNDPFKIGALKDKLTGIYWFFPV